MWYYSDYLEVRSDLVDVYSQERDKEDSRRWKGFIPHEGFYRLLTNVLDAVERKKDKQKSMWIHGPYGTGKTFAAFVLKHLLEDPIEEVEEYLKQHDLTRNLWPRVKSLREKGPYLVVYRSSSAHITSSVRLFAEIQEAVKAKLIEQGHKHGFERACLDTVLEDLEGQRSTFDWKKAFELHRWDRFEDFSSPDEVVTAIKQGDIAITEKVAQLLDEERFVRLNDPQKMKEGLDEVIKRNNLQGVFFIWDEFTDFFMNNVKLSDIQELAHASASMPWYMVLVTHKSPDVLSGDRDTMNKVLERFHRVHLELQRVTAYQLAQNAIRVVPDSRDEWETRREALWGQVQIAQLVSHLFDVNDQYSKAEDFKRLVPLHPYSAFLLSTISASFSSSQRTLFKFLGADDLGGFKWFLSQYPGDEERFWVTPDILWDYFLGEKAEESELTDKVRNVVNYYRSRKDDLTSQQTRQLWKGIMLFIALSREVPGEQRLFPTKSTLKLAFRGTEVEQQLEEIASQLSGSESRFITVVPRGYDEQYEIPLYGIDDKKLGDIKRQLENTESFEQRIRETDEFGKALTGVFRLSQAPSRRHVLRVVSVRELGNRGENVQPQIKSYQVGMVVVACFAENELSKAQELCKQAAKTGERIGFMVIDNPFGEERWKRWLEDKALCRYCQDMQDVKNAQFHEGQARERVADWIREVQNGRHHVYFGLAEPKTIEGREGYEQWFKEIIDKVFPQGPEKITTLATIYEDWFGKEKFLIGLGQKKTLSEQFKELHNLFTAYEEAPDSFSGHPLGSMKARVDAIFANEQEVGLRDLWEHMQQSPIGLFPSQVAAALMGFLMKDYCEGHYWSDGTSCYPVDPTKMAELLNKVLKEERGHEDIVIRKMTPAAEDFCATMREAFDLPENQAQYPGPVRNALRIKLQNLAYPLWALQYHQQLDSSIRYFLACVDILLKDTEDATESVLQDPHLTDSNAKIERLLSRQQEERRKPSDIREAVLLIMDSRGTQDGLTSRVASVLKKEEFQRGMLAFVDNKVPQLEEKLKTTKMGIDWVVGRVKYLMQEEVWLWTEEVVAEKLGDVQADLSLLHGLNRLCAINEGDPQRAVERFKDEWLPGKSKLPLSVIAIASSGETKWAIEVLDDLSSGKWPETETRLRFGELLGSSPTDVREAVANQPNALRIWAKQNLNEDLSAGDAQQVIGALPDLSREKDEHKFKGQIAEACANLSRAKLAREVRQRWNELTLSESPLAWSRSHNVPVRWALEGREFTKVFDIIDQAGEKTEHELREAVGIIQEKQGQIQKLRDRVWPNQRLIEVLIPDSAEMIESADDLDELKARLVGQIGEEVEHWPDSQSRARGIANDWIKDLYHRKGYERVIQDIEGLSVSDVKNLLRELARDPAIGTRLLKRLKNAKR